MHPLIGVVQSSRKRGGAGGGGVSNMGITYLGGIATLSYTPLELERCKNPRLSRVTVSPSVGIEVGDTLVATLVGSEIRGPFAAATAQYQWYRLASEKGATPEEIVGATSFQYTLTEDDEDHHMAVKARSAITGGFSDAHNFSPWRYSRMTDVVVAAGAPGDIPHAWLDFFDMVVGQSIQADFNTGGVDPTLINLGTGDDPAPTWNAVAATKPVHSTDKIVFAGGQRVTGPTLTTPLNSEIWIKGKYTANNGAMIGFGSQTLFGMNSSNQWFIRDTSGFATAGDLNEHVWRIVLNGASSIFQVDGGVENVFTHNFSAATSLAFGQTFSGANQADCEIKRFQRTVHATLLTAPEVAAKWAYHGF